VSFLSSGGGTQGRSPCPSRVMVISIEPEPANATSAGGREHTLAHQERSSNEYWIAELFELSYTQLFTTMGTLPACSAKKASMRWGRSLR